MKQFCSVRAARKPESSDAFHNLSCQDTKYQIPSTKYYFFTYNFTSFRLTSAAYNVPLSSTATPSAPLVAL
jgi:hypothetical protein